MPCLTECGLLRIDAVEEDFADGSVLAHAEFSEHSERILENI
jgi:hypothetical protein